VKRKDQKKILVVDDDAEMTLMIRDILEANHYEVTRVHDGPEAVQKANQENFDLVLLDIRMPYFSGIWFCDAFKRRSQTRNTPVIIVSGLPPQENMQQAYHVGASAYLAKPFRPPELLNLVEKVLSESIPPSA